MDSACVRNPSALLQIPQGIPSEPSRLNVPQRIHHSAPPPISRLPTELLAIIFLFHAVESHVFSHAEPPPTWIALSQVCRRWRCIALGYPQLWTNIVLSNRHWTAEMLARSQPLPISINAAFSERPLMHAIEDALKETPRARHIRLSSSIIQRLVDQLRNYPAPHLESLSLSQGALPCIVPDDMFRGEIPLLRSLELTGTSMNWTSSILRPTLTHLEIRDACRATLPNIEDMLAALAHMPILDTLILVRSLPPNRGEQARDFPPNTGFAELVLSLPALTTLHIADTTLQCAYFMSHISIPIDAELSIDCAHDAVLEPLQSVRAIEALLSQHLSHPREAGLEAKLTPFSKIGVALDGEAGVFLRAGYMDPSQPADPSRWTPRLTLSLRWPVNAPSMLYSELLVSRACSLLPLEDLHSLSIAGNFFSYGAIWLSTFGRMKRVEELVVHDSAASGFVEAFKHKPSSVREIVYTILELPGNDAVGVEVGDVLLFPMLKEVSLAKSDSNATLRLFGHLNDEFAIRKDWTMERGLEK